jgi:hypothetical protein
MSKRLRTLAAGAAIVAGLAAAPALYAQDYLAMPHGSMMGQGTMGQGGMMEDCGTMMQGMGGTQRRNEQWRTPQPEQPGQRQA